MAFQLNDPALPVIHHSSRNEIAGKASRVLARARKGAVDSSTCVKHGLIKPLKTIAVMGTTIAIGGMRSVWVVWSCHAPAHGMTSAISPRLLYAAAADDVARCLRLIGSMPWDCHRPPRAVISGRCRAQYLQEMKMCRP
jgi:hypothetical protein